MAQLDRDSRIGTARIVVIGVGGGGNNAVNRMLEASLTGITFVAANTDQQALKSCKVEDDKKLTLGGATTKGLGAGGKPGVGEKAAQESKEEIKRFVEGADMVIVTAGMGGGTGTGGAPVVAEIAHDQGALTIGVVTKPFAMEGARRMRNAEEGIEKLRTKVDTLIVVPNERLLQAVPKNTSLGEAFRLADDVLRQVIFGISSLITETALINLDFADVRAVMENRGLAHIGIGVASGEDRLKTAVKSAVESPLLETKIDGASAVLINVTGGTDVSISDINEAVKDITDKADKDANIILGAAIDESLDETKEVRVTVIATGFDTDAKAPDKKTAAGTTTAQAKSAEEAPSSDVQEIIDQLRGPSGPSVEPVNTPPETSVPSFLRNAAPAPNPRTFGGNDPYVSNNRGGERDNYGYQQSERPVYGRDDRDNYQESFNNGSQRPGTFREDEQRRGGQSGRDLHIPSYIRQQK